LNALGFSKNEKEHAKDPRNGRPSIENTVADNGMETGYFFINMHLDNGQYK